MIKILIKLMPGAKLPEYATQGAAGFDLCTLEEVRMVPGLVEKVRTGLCMEVPVGYELQIRPRSGMAKRGIIVANSPGTIDSDYRGEICILLKSDVGVDIPAGTRIAQGVLQKVPKAEFVIVDELSTTERGDGGFGSTGA